MSYVFIKEGILFVSMSICTRISQSLFCGVHDNFLTEQDSNIFYKFRVFISQIAICGYNGRNFVFLIISFG